MFLGIIYINRIPIPWLRESAIKGEKDGFAGLYSRMGITFSKKKYYYYFLFLLCV
jgi:hypothetical protein